MQRTARALPGSGIPNSRVKGRDCVAWIRIGIPTKCRRRKLNDGISLGKLVAYAVWEGKMLDVERKRIMAGSYRLPGDGQSCIHRQYYQ